jgi:ATP-dependent Clp protease ATP-binding subunit ClpC
MERHTTSRLVGAPPGYVGYDEGGQLTEAVRRRPYSVVLLDEIEKAHPEVFNILLQVLEDGRLTEAKGRTVDFRNTVIIMTSNAGAQVIRGDKQLGFATQESSEAQHEKMKSRVMDEVKKLFRPEFINRLDDLIIFHSLDKEHLKSIVGLEVKKVGARVKELGATLTLSEAALEKLVTEGYDPTYGARPLRRAIQRLLEDPLSEEMLRKPFKWGELVQVVVDEDGKMVFQRTEPNAQTVGAMEATTSEVQSE